MRKLLTDRTVQQLTPPVQGRTEMGDDKTRGLALRVSAGGHKGWVAVWRRDGRTRRLALGSYSAVSLADARDRVQQVLAAVARGEVWPVLAALGQGCSLDEAREMAQRAQAAQPSAPQTVRMLAAEYVEKYAKARKRSWAADDRTLRVDVLPVLGEMHVTAVQRRHIRDLLDGITARGTAARPNRTHANRVRALLHAVFAFAVRREVLNANPVDGVERQPETPREKVLSADEIRAIFGGLAEQPAAMQRYVRLLFLSAGRGGELLRLRWENVTIEPEAWLTFPADITKSKREHRVPLSGAAVAVLRELRELAGVSPWLFPSPKSPRGRRTANQDFYKRLRAESGVAFVGHDARRWCATTMAAGGIPLEVVGRVLGHSDQSVTARHYAKASYATEMRRALEMLARQLDAVLTSTAPAKVVPLRA